ncbi:tRNA-specific 2-thiouridylase MnmA [Psychroflexus gondwanensis ACAM 44]|jgi:tRNA-specific 2-thiouridylase|uniref:tRNA-specific 2-thiouridylase MnmA n=1 Tax=Psychroflexus gondwanensis ACAM 44 TaxID=1189619 RepID=N1WYP2_9FLAO|nr:tRNA 2-thiouridine(34) synthase MnmA [Psychroflexus gondwanensis]EMY80968.1 tRNA-specific 2-thiouridylase MnmA [Psychroflexus gondwanensis ACAM 44]
MKRVVVGLSGGVDSSVAAYLCKEQGYEVIGLFMKNWHDDSVTISDECPWLEDSNDAMLVAEKLGIPFQTVDLSKQYKERIVDYMFAEYERGRTPNPDVLCNREIKFDVFMDIATSLGADYVATGHYCRKDKVEKNGEPIYRLLAGKDANKDQSYFLCQVSQKQLAKTLFPVGELQKSEVREIAKSQNLITADKKDSQGLCFIGKVKLPDFLQQKLQPKQGQVIEIDSSHDVFKAEKSTKANSELITQLKKDSKKLSLKPEFGKVLGTHDGAHFFTKGQRKGLAIGGTKEPLFVIDTDVKNNILYTGQGKTHPGLHKKGLWVTNDEVHWIRQDLELKEGDTMEVMARIRYRQALEKAKLYQMKDELYVIFEDEQTAISEGQFVAWYHEDELLGSGVIA